MKRDDSVGRPDPGAELSSEDDVFVFVFFRTMYLVPLLVWAFGGLATAALWILVSPLVGGVFVGVFLLGVFGWTFARALRIRRRAPRASAE